MSFSCSGSDCSDENCSRHSMLAKGCCAARFTGNTNLVDLPWLVTRQLDQYLSDGSAQMKLLCQLSSEEFDISEAMILLNNSSSPTEQLLQLLGKQGKCVNDFLNYCHNAGVREPQLILHRKFEHVKIVRQPQVVEHQTEPNTLLIACLASGFPYPNYQWYCNSTLLKGEAANVLSLRVECVSQGAVYYCVASNEIPIDAAQRVQSFNECLCTEEVLSMMQEKSPAMSVILLDICRTPDNFEVPIDDFVRYKSRVNRNTVIGYATSFGEGAYEVVGEPNGMFMKYLKKYLQLRKPVPEILTLVMRDLENDIQAKRVQFPEVRTNMSKLRSLADPLIFDGHTATYDLRTYRWQQLHQLPEPMKITFSSLGVFALIWFDFHGYFSNMAIVYTSVLSIPTESGEQTNAEHEYVAMLILPDIFDSASAVITLGENSRTAVKTLVKNLQRLTGTVELQLQLQELEGRKVKSVATVVLSHILISKLNDTADADCAR